MPTVQDLYNDTTRNYNKKKIETFDMLIDYILTAVERGNYSVTIVLNEGENDLFEYQYDAIGMVMNTWLGIGFTMNQMDRHIVTFSWDEIDTSV